LKDKRNIIDIKDFSGGLITNTPITSMDSKFTPDCINVYSEGNFLKRRSGFSKLNTNTVAAGSRANGVFNWVKNASEQLLIAVFGGAIYKMDISGTSWDGTFDVISASAVSGQPFSDSIVHFATYAGTLLWTTEARNHPQRIGVSDSSHSDIESGGAGVAPDGKYIQVWKDHVWILNIGAGGALTEEFDSISAWNNTDTGTGLSSAVTTNGLNALKQVGANAGTQSDAIIFRDIGDLQDNYIIETKTYFDAIEGVSAASTSTGYVHMHWDNGIVRLESRFSDDGLEVYDGAAWNEVGVDLVSEDVWITWKFFVTAGTATAAFVDIQKDGSYVGLGYDITSASADTASDGEIRITAFGSTGIGATHYVDYMYINSSAERKEGITNGEFDTFSGNTADNWSSFPTQPLIHFKMNDDTTSETITNDGVEGSNATVFAGGTTVDTDQVSDTGKISKTISFTSASSHNIELNTTSVASMTDDNVGTIAMWVFPDDDESKTVFAVGDSNANTVFRIVRGGGGALEVTLTSTGTDILKLATPNSSVGSGSWTHIALTQNATSAAWYVNGATVGVTLNAGTSSNWFNDLPDSGALDTALIGAREFNSGGKSNFFDGKIDDFRYYSTAVTSDEIAAIYAEGAGTEGYITTVQEGTIVKTGSNSYELQDNGTYNVLSQTLASSGNFAGKDIVFGAWVFAENTDEYKFVIDDGTTENVSATFTGNGTWQYQIFSATPASGTTALKTKIVCVSGGTVYIDHANIIDTDIDAIDSNSDRIQRSALTLLNDWSGTDSGSNDIVTPGDIGLTGSFILADRMYVTKAYSIHRFTYTGSIPLVDIKQIRSSIGTRSPRTMKNVVISGEGEVEIFLGSDRRLYQFNGFDSTVISSNIEFDNGITSTYMNNINAQALDKCFAVLHDDQSWYELFVPIGSSTSPDFSFIYDYSSGAFWPCGNRNFRSGAQSDNGAGQRVVYVGGNTTGFAYLTRSGNSDDGSSINGNWVSPKLGDSTILSRYDQINLLTESVAATPTLQWREDFNTTYVSETLASVTNQHNYDPRLTDNFLQLRINEDSTNAAFKIWSLRVLNKSIGHGK
jgi:hypothetical protein